MPEFALLRTLGLTRSVGTVLASTSATVITAASTAHVKSSAWAEIVASTAADASFVTVYISGGSVAANFLLDIAIGAGGSERIIFANLMSQPGHALQNGYVYQFPFFIPGGSRLSAKVQSSTLSATIQVCLSLTDYSFLGMPALSQMETYGATTASSTGTVIDPGASANTKPALPMTQLIASTAFDIKVLVLAFGHIATTTTVNRTWYLDVGLGASSSEITKIADIMIQDEATGDMCDPTVIWFPVTIPSGSRISARAQSDVATVTARNVNLIAYGVG